MDAWWHSQQWRLIQTNLREIDMLDIDAQQVVEDLQSFKANVLLLNAAGIIASYPTDLPFHFQSPYLKGDSLQEILDACHGAGIRVMARTDFSKVRRPIYEAHPDWAYRTPEGEIVDYNGDVHVCINGPYQQAYAFSIIEELFETLDFDGIFFNMGGYQTRDYSGNDHGICHCQHCRRRFEAMYGMPLPEAEDLADPVYRTYLEFKQRTLADHGAKVYRFITERWPDVCIANHTAFNRGFIRQESNTAIRRPLPHWQYSASDNTKWAVRSFPEMVSSNTTVDFIDFPYRHVAVSPHQQTLRLAQNLANGGALDYYLIGRLDNHEDRSGFAGIRDLFHYHAEHEETYVDLLSQANVLLLKQSGPHTDEYRGWFRFLVENHVLFDVVRTDAALDVSWKRYDTLVVPELEAMSDALAQRLDAFVEAGGTLVAVGQTGFRDAFYNPRTEPALACLGIEDVKHIREDMRASYLKFVDPDDKDGFPRMEETDLVYVDGAYVYATYADEAETRMHLIPPHNFGPPERCYYDQVTDHPGLIVHPFGEGCAIYLPWSPGALFHRQGHLNTADFCGDLLLHIAEAGAVHGNLSPMVEVTRFSKKNGSYDLIHLVNGSGHFGNSFYAPVTMHDVRFSIECESRPQEVIGLRGRDRDPEAEAPTFDWTEGTLSIVLPELRLFEALKVVW
jgi:hypothetical protein